MKKYLIILLLLIGCSEKETCVYVYDGDTIKLSTGEVIRLSGIDCNERGQFFGDSATAFTTRYLLNKEVRIIRHGHDKYKRSIAEIEVNGQDISELLVLSGLAHTNRWSDERLRKLYLRAKMDKAGQFKYDYTELPYQYRKSKN